MEHILIYDIELPIDSYLPYAKLHIFNINRNQKIFWTNDPTSFGPFVYGLIDIINNSIENEYYVNGYAMKIEK